MIPGPDNFPRSVLPVCASVTLPSGNVDANVLAANLTVTLPSSPRVGEFTKISATAGAVNVLGGAFPIVGVPAGVAFVVPSGQTVRFTFTTQHTWIALFT